MEDNKRAPAYHSLATSLKQFLRNMFQFADSILQPPPLAYETSSVNTFTHSVGPFVFSMAGLRSLARV